MTIDQLIEMLQRRVVHLNSLRAAAAQIGDVACVDLLDADISETETTLAQLQTLG